MNGAALPWSSVASVRSFALRAVCFTGLVLALAQYASQPLVEVLLPCFRAVLRFVAGDFNILRLDFVRDAGNTAVGAMAMLGHTVVIGERAVVPDDTSVLMVTSAVGIVLQPLWVALVLLLSWPGRWRELALRWVIGLSLIALLLLTETPLTMAVRLSDMLSQAHGQGAPWQAWAALLNGGGRFGLGLIAAASSIAVAHALVTRNQPEPARAESPIEKA